MGDDVVYAPTVFMKVIGFENVAVNPDNPISDNAAYIILEQWW